MQITRGIQARAQKVVLYGPEGIGKTTLAAQCPGPVFIDTEGGSNNFDVARYPAPNCWQNLIQTVQYAMQHPANQQTLVIDTADWAEKLAVTAVCDRSGKTGIEDFGYGKGYTYLKEEFAKLLTYLDGVIDAGVHVVLTAHAALRKIEQPDEMGAYDHWELKLSKTVAPMVKEWADALLFCNYKTIVVQDSSGKGKAQGGRRVIYTQHHPCWDAKNRHGLPPELPMEYAAIAPIFGGPAASETPQPTAPPAPQPAPPAPAPAPTVPAAQTAQSAPAGGISPALRQRYPALARLMEASGITPEEVQRVVGERGYFPPDMPVEQYPEDFVSAVLVAAWQDVAAMIRPQPQPEQMGLYELPADEPLPF